MVSCRLFPEAPYIYNSSVYAPQVSRPEPEKERFYDTLQYMVAMVPKTEILIPVGDWNSHIDDPASVFSDAHGFVPITQKVKESWNSSQAMESASATPGSGRETHT